MFALLRNLLVTYVTPCDEIHGTACKHWNIYFILSLKHALLNPHRSVGKLSKLKNRIRHLWLFIAISYFEGVLPMGHFSDEI